MKVRFNMHDAFSFCVQSIEKELTKEQLVKAEQMQANEVPYCKFENNINYAWIIDEIEIIEA